MTEGKKQSLSGLGAIGCLGLIIFFIATLVLGGVPGAFIDIQSSLIVLVPTFFLLLMVYGKDFLRFIPRSILALFSKNVEPDPLFAKIAESGSRYVIASGAIGTCIGIITMLQSLDDPAKIGCGMAVSLLSLFYSLIISEFYFISVYNIFSSESKKGETSGNKKMTRLHFFIPALMILLILVYFFLLFVDLPPNETGEGHFSSNGSEISMSPIICNVAGTHGKRSIKILPVIEVSSPAVYKYFYNKSYDNPEGMNNKIRADLVDIISEKPLESLLGKKAKYDLSQEVKKELNDILEEKRACGIVREVYFREYLIQ